ncbi:Protein phosphatase CheZ (plasmid) [Photobacterium kishitanii]|uniref:protein phosphatase CheZ n=2 Tax=Photobacterium kishitanii TaxID=318456 RepID=UPI0005ADFB74|nr:protein phosphatase CheZ [Photobacterium kishitanii]PSV04630.1 protein phosphatase CheZ [Photobacterium kishitanii]CEO42156.1 Protein phosphatase CheZ [Photobacterium kishitanii]
MMSIGIQQNKPLLSLDQLQQIQDFIEMDMIEDANNIISGAVQKQNKEELFNGVGMLTREVHDALHNFVQDMRLQELASIEMRDARTRLNYVINMTEDAANRTMDNVDITLNVILEIGNVIASLTNRWDTLMSKDISIDEFRTLVYDLDSFIKLTKRNTAISTEKLNDIIMAQEFQDISGQIIKKAINLTIEVEDSLVELLKLFKVDLEDCSVNHIVPELEGPVPTGEYRDDIMGSQDDVDDLLSSLGF